MDFQSIALPTELKRHKNKKPRRSLCVRRGFSPSIFLQELQRRRMRIISLIVKLSKIVSLMVVILMLMKTVIVEIHTY